jgi:hypothetical protein
LALQFASEESRKTRGAKHETFALSTPPAPSRDSGVSSTAAPCPWVAPHALPQMDKPAMPAAANPFPKTVLIRLLGIGLWESGTP